jgi:hypothetical protein
LNSVVSKLKLLFIAALDGRFSLPVKSRAARAAHRG